ncbi:ISL3 family transposase [Gordonia sp. JH63]|uniref:ISL3 family transposase n=3 Tax=unclassified Gordonia (in: high G+C Gram-positive bacteria) TaxID=2657482 RepID=UPI00193A3E6C|nr:ISL3 family transposase [Gordonia sp. JH63]
MRTVRVLQKLLGIERARVVGVRFDEDDRGHVMVATLELHKNARSRCPQCKKRCPGYDQPPAPRLWRHLDMGGWRCFLELPATRVRCPRHGVKTELVPWARPEVKMTRAFDDTVAWMCAHAPMTAVSAYLRVSWRTVSRIVERVVDDHVGLTKRLNGLRRIGIDEIAYRKGRRYLVVVVNHDTGQLVWAGEGAKKATIERFFDELGDVRAGEITHISADGAEYIGAVLAERAPGAYWCMDPFHVLQWVNQALDRCRSRVMSRIAGLSKVERGRLRWALLKNPDNLTESQERLQSIVVADANSVLARAYQMKEEIRHILSGAYSSCWAPLRRWLRKAETCDIPEIRTLAPSIRKREVQIYNAVTCQMSNARVEATNCHLRSLTKRSYGFHTPDALIAMANLTRGGACPELPHRN